MSTDDEGTQSAPADDPDAAITEQQVREAQDGEQGDTASEPSSEFVAPVDPGDGSQSGEGPGGAEQGAGEPEGGAGDEANRQAQALSEKEIEKIRGKLDAEDKRHTGRITEILGDAAIDFEPCPLCSHNIAGWIYPPQLAPLPEEAIEGTRAVLGLAKPRQLKHASDTTTCDECNGEGQVETGSHRQGYEVKDCGPCGATGYRTRGQVPLTNGQHEHPEGVTGPTVFPQDVSSDPAVQALKDRGFVVIPPMVSAQGA